MTNPRFLPKYVVPTIDRHGKQRLRFKRRGFPGGYFKAAIGTEDFRTEYRAFMDASIVTPAAQAIERASPGTVDDLVTQYFAVPTRLGPTATTQAKVRRIIGKFREEYRNLPVARIGFQHVEAIVAGKLTRSMVQTDRGMRPIGGPEAARKLLKELIRLFKFGVKIEMMASNPAAKADPVKIAAGERSKGHHTWTEDEIAQYRAHHALGTKARLAMELLLWTDQRRGDAIHLGRQHIRDGRFRISQSKTGKDLGIAVAPQLLEAIVAMPPAKTGGMCFLLSEHGKPFANASFGNWFRKKCDAAGLTHCSAHGLRKATMRRMAELGMGNQTMKAVSGHSKDDEVARYTAAANQQRMADQAIAELARWEKEMIVASALGPTRDPVRVQPIANS